jgi:hypothetical protein
MNAAAALSCASLTAPSPGTGVVGDGAAAVKGALWGRLQPAAMQRQPEA